MKIEWGVLAVCFLIVILVAYLGSMFTSKGTNSQWYESIKPKITPPNWVFPIAWGILFFLIALSLYFAWTNSGNKKIIIIIFAINFILNILWSLFYFGLKNPGVAFFNIVLLLISIGSMIFMLWRINLTSSVLLIPYFLWVGFASILNYLSIK